MKNIMIITKTNGMKISLIEGQPTLSLFLLKGDVIMNQEILDLINRRENQILLHSCIYYKFNDNLIEDWQYDSIGKDLLELAKDYPDEFKASYHYEEFIDYVNSDTPSGFNLRYSTVENVSKAMHLLRLYGRNTTKFINDDSQIKK